MSITKLRNEKTLAPFMGARLNYVTGQDQLGLLNVADRTFSTVLPGLNNVTSRIRYYSFYCWFYHKYAEEIGVPSSYDQNKYLRRAEYLLALINSSIDGLQGIPGSSKATISLSEEIETINLLEGTYEGKEKFDGSYWKYSSGIFGQNYKASMESIGLIRSKDDENQNVYIRTKYEVEGMVSGYQLAKAFENGIDLEMSKLFIEILKRGEVTKVELQKLSPSFHMRKLNSATEEHVLLLDLLSSSDIPGSENPTFYRKDTIRLLLDSIESNKSSATDLDVPNEAYQKKGIINETYDNTYTFWYYFMLEQYWHQICTGCLWSILQILFTENHFLEVRESILLDTIVDRVKTILESDYSCSTNDRFVNIDSKSFSESELVEKTKLKDSFANIAHMMILLKRIMDENESEVNRLDQFSKKHKINSLSSFTNSYKQLVKMTEMNISTFIKSFLTKYILERHQLVSLRKMNATQSTEKFIRENGWIRFVEPIEYGYSSPRIGTLLGFLVDLQIINKDASELTLDGKSFLNTL